MTQDDLQINFSKHMPKSRANKNDSQTTLRDLLVMKLESLFDVENALVKALPAMAKAATHEELKAAFENHLEETQVQVGRLEQIFELLDTKPKAMKVEAIRGLVADAEWAMKNVEGERALDAALISAARAVEHYEMAGYKTAAEWAMRIGQTEAEDFLRETLEEEEETERILNDLATSEINELANTGAKEGEPPEGGNGDY
jgi:ferritin-like metal-binding protein YciE